MRKRLREREREREREKEEEKKGEGEIFPYRSLCLLSFLRKLADLKEGFFKGSFYGLIKKARFQDKRLETSFLLLRDRKVASCR